MYRITQIWFETISAQPRKPCCRFCIFRLARGAQAPAPELTRSRCAPVDPLVTLHVRHVRGKFLCHAVRVVRYPFKRPRSERNALPIPEEFNGSQCVTRVASNFQISCSAFLPRVSFTSIPVVPPGWLAYSTPPASTRVHIQLRLFSSATRFTRPCPSLMAMQEAGQGPENSDRNGLNTLVRGRQRFLHREVNRRVG